MKSRDELESAIARKTASALRRLALRLLATADAMIEETQDRERAAERDEVADADRLH